MWLCWQCCWNKWISHAWDDILFYWRGHSHWLSMFSVIFLFFCTFVGTWFCFCVFFNLTTTHKICSQRKKTSILGCQITICQVFHFPRLCLWPLGSVTFVSTTVIWGGKVKKEIYFLKQQKDAEHSLFRLSAEAWKLLNNAQSSSQGCNLSLSGCRR